MHKKNKKEYNETKTERNKVAKWEEKNITGHNLFYNFVFKNLCILYLVYFYIVLCHFFPNI